MCVASGDGSKQRERREERKDEKRKERGDCAREVRDRKRAEVQYLLLQVHNYSVCVCVGGDSLVGRYTSRCLPVLRVPPDVSPYV